MKYSFKSMMTVLLCLVVFGVTILTGCDVEDSVGNGEKDMLSNFETNEKINGKIQKEDISFKTLIVNEHEARGVFSNGTVEFDFNGEITVQRNITYIVSYDEHCVNIVTNKKVSLVEGDNIYYVTASLGKESVTYKVVLRRRPMYTVSFDTAGGTAIAEQLVEENGIATKPSVEPERNGYTFIGWENDFSAPITSNTVIKAKWSGRSYVVTYDANTGVVANATTNVTCGVEYTLEKPQKVGYAFMGWYYGNTSVSTKGTWNISENVTLKAKWTAYTNTKYTIEHYIEKFDGTYELKETETRRGKSDGYVNPSTKQYKGFTAPAPQTVLILPDGSQVVKYYYARNSYTVNFITNGGDAISSQSQKYNAKLPDIIATRDGFTFGGWFSDAGLSKTVTTMPANNITLYAYWMEENKPVDFHYTQTDSITITGYIANDTTVTIPSYIAGKKVTGIGYGSFYDCTMLESITIPDGVTIIDYNAFFDCTSLASIIIPESVTSIGDDAFRGCTRLESITIPGSVTSIGDAVFYECTSLNSIIISEGVKSIGRSAFYGCMSLVNVAIPSSIVSIGDQAFYDCHNIQYTIYNNAKYLGNSENPYNMLVEVIDTSVASITIADGVRYIGNYSFERCVNLTSIELPDGLISIGNSAFFICTKLERIVIPDTVTSIGNNAFENCSSLINITMYNGVEKIGDYAFAFCNKLTSITIPTSVTSIGDYAFFSCKSLTSIEIPNGITSIGDYMVAFCDKLTSITIPNSVTSFSNYAFFYCNSLASVYYNGTPAEWQKINFGLYNEVITSATVYYYSENQPTGASDQYWYYVNGVPTKWQTI